MRLRRASCVDVAPTVESGAELIPGYRAVALLAHGGRLDTWDAFDEVRGVRCVLKMLRSDRLHEPAVRAAVLQEGHLVTTLAHPHLVRGYDVLDDPVPTVVLETLRGATLDAILDEATLDVPDLAALGLQLCSAVSYLHRHDWLHLDVKPANVVVDHGKAVLIDLSLAGRPGAGRRGAGTRGYLSPEQARGHGLSTATDAWGIGVTLLECLSGDLPFGDEATWDTRRRWPVVHRRMPTVPVLPGGAEQLPTPLVDLLTACVDLDPAVRPRLADVVATLTPLAAPEHAQPWAVGS